MSLIIYYYPIMMPNAASEGSAETAIYSLCLVFGLFLGGYFGMYALSDLEWYLDDPGGPYRRRDLFEGIRNLVLAVGCAVAAVYGGYHLWVGA